MGFFSQEITKPNYHYYMQDYYKGVATEAFYGQIEAVTQYTEDLWAQWENYRTMGEEAIAGMSTAIDSRYNTMKDRIDTTFGERVEDVKELTKRRVQDQRFRGMSNVQRKATHRYGDEMKGDLQEAKDREMSTLDTQRKEWEDQAALRKLEIQKWIEGSKPLQVNPGPAMKEAYQMKLAEYGMLGQDRDVVVGEEGGWGSLLLTGLGAGVGALFGPTGMMVGAGLGGALGGAGEMAFGAPGYQQQGGSQFVSGLLGAGMAGFSPYADWSWNAGQQYGTNPFTGAWEPYSQYQQSQNLWNEAQNSPYGWILGNSGNS